MFEHAYQRRKNQLLLVLITAGFIAGLVFALLADGLKHPMPLINASLGGALIGLYTALIENRLFTPRFRRRIRFIPMMALRIFLYTIMISIILFTIFAVSRVFWFDLSLQEVFKSAEFRELLRREFGIAIIYSVSITGIAIFTYQITRKIGPRFLINMITGKYYHPRQSRVIFMFVRIEDAESISRELGLLSYYNFFNDLLYDITPPLVAHKAHIYQYVDNEMVFYWYPAEGRSQAACIRTYFAICDRLYEYREKFIDKYKSFPVLQTAVHIGDVVQGEIGYGKTEIDFYGDVLNTCSRMLQQCTKEQPFIISSEIKALINLPSVYGVNSTGKITLRGKSKPMNLYHVYEKPIRTMPV